MRARSLFDIDRSTAANDPRSSASFSAPKNSSTYSSEYASGFSGSAASQLVVPPSPRYESNVGQAPRRWDEPRLSTRIQFAHIPPSSIGRSDLFLEGGSGLGHRRRNARRQKRGWLRERAKCAHSRGEDARILRNRRPSFGGRNRFRPQPRQGHRLPPVWTTMPISSGPI